MSARTTARHADWLSLVEPSGPFVTLPVLRRALPEGLERSRPDLRSELRDRVDDLGREPGAREEFVGWVLRTLLGFNEQVRGGQAVPDAFMATEQVHHVTLRPTFVVLDRQDPSRARLLVSVHPAGTNLTAHLAGERWAASPVDRMTTLCRSVGCVLGLVTDGERFTLVWAPVTGPVGRATWVASIFSEGSERNLLDSFTTLLGAKRFFAASSENRLEALLAESAQAQADLTGQLGLQVRRATELLVAALSRADRDWDGQLLSGVVPHTVYEAAATVMMRLVFLLYAEERRLLPLGDELYDASYAASTLREALRETADRLGDYALEHRATAWPRLLATFRAVYGGLAHDRLRIPAYGGRLFDPDRYPFLEGRGPAESWRTGSSEPITVDDRSMLGILDALQMLETREGGATEKRRLAFRALDVEQIGHVYEGLLDHSAVAITKPTVGLVGKAPGSEPEVSLDDLEAQVSRGREALAEWLHEKTEKSKPYIYKQLECELDDDRSRRILAACDNDPKLAKRIEPVAYLVRDDLRGMPIVLPRGSMYVTETSHRRDTGTEYTPRELADEVVKHALEPLVYDPGPASEPGPAKWKLKSSEEILDLRVCDPAVGSGAFLVAACRFLADRVVEAWTAEKSPLIGELSAQAPPEGEVDDLTIEARRRVAERCLFGIDRDPMAVEMAKLSLWLTTMARERPFSFLDHAIQSGDSLLGVTDVEQVLRLHIDPNHQKQLPLAGSIIPAVERAVELRRRVEAVPVREIGDAEEKARLLREADQALAPVKVVADLIVGASLMTAAPGSGPIEDLLGTVEPDVIAAFDPTGSAEDRAHRLAELSSRGQAWLNSGRPEGTPARRCLHWPLSFGETFNGRSGFDAVIGNPPFLTGKKLLSRMGGDVREHLVTAIGGGVRAANADLVAYFFLRAARVSPRIGLLATNTIAQGETREVALQQLLAKGWRIDRAVKSTPWPGRASLEISKVWAGTDQWTGRVVLDGADVVSIGAGLDPLGRVSGRPHQLAANADGAFQGSFVLGLGFTMPPQEARRLIEANPRNRDVLFPCLNGEDVNSAPTHVASRWIINFFDWPLERAAHASQRDSPVAADYPDCLDRVFRLVKPERDRLGLKKEPSAQGYARLWWQYGRRALALYGAIRELKRVLVVARVSKIAQPVFVASGQVYMDALAVFAYDDDFHFGVLSSAFHWHWAVKYASTLETRIRYTPSDVFETFPQPPFRDAVAAAGKALHEHRAALMVKNNEGLTKTYNRVHNASDTSPGIVTLRELHRHLDHAVRDAYGWHDLDLDHGFHGTSQGVRFTISPAARAEVLDLLLELNHARYADEMSRGLHGKKKTAKKPHGTDSATREVGQAKLFGSRPGGNP